MAKLREEAEAIPDDLEIISIGALYKGQWDKKYWSCSRGKDRYPYPVGYQAVRSQDGNRCKLEIHEGSKGPVFAITNADGLSYSGETPAIAWAKFQKKCFPHMKIWHGKRFSCKIDGIEFFGFKNAFVQRLLRELVANLDVEAQRSLLSSTFCNGASVPEQERGCMSTCADPELLACIPKPPTTGKRRQRRGAVTSLGIGSTLKRLERQMQSSETSSHSRQKRQKDCRNTLFSEENNVMTVAPVSFQGKPSSHDVMLSSEIDEDGPVASIHRKYQTKDSDGSSNGIGRADIAGGSNDRPGNCVSTEIVDTNTCHLILSCKEGENDPAANIHKKDQIIDSVELPSDKGRAGIVEGSNAYPGNSMSSETFGSACKLEEPLDRFGEMVQMNSSTSMDDNEGVFVADSVLPDYALCVDDTIDELQDNSRGHATAVSHTVYHSKLEDESGVEHAVKPEDKSCSFAPTATMKDSHCNLEYKSAADQMVKTEAIVDESCLEEETGPYISAGSSERSDFDSVGQEIDKTMMSVWLPQAVPLLKKYSRKKKKLKTRDATLSGLTQMKKGVFPIQARNADVAIKIPENAESSSLESLKVNDSGDQAYYKDIPDSMDMSAAATMLNHEKLQSISDKKPLEDESHSPGHTQMKQEVFPIQARNADVAIKIPENVVSSALENLKVDESGGQAYYQDIPDSMDMSAAATMLNHEKLQSISDKKPLEDESHSPGHTQMKQEVFPIQARNADVAIKIPENAESSALKNLKVDESVGRAYYQDIPDSMDTSAAATMLNHEKLESISDKKPLEDESHSPAHVLTYKPDGSHFSENVSLHIDTISSKKHFEDLKVSKECSADENEAATSSKNTGETFRGGYQHGDCIPTMALEKVCEVPLSESIICRISATDYLPDSSLSNPNLLAQSIHLPSSMDKTNHSNHNTGEPVLDGDLNVLKIPTATLEAEDELRLLPVVFKNRTSISASKKIEHSFAPSVSQVKEAQSPELMTIDENKNTTQSEDSIPSPGPAAGFSDELFIIAEDQARLHPQITANVKLHNDLEEILQLVGCYSHSLPVMSVLLRRKGNELYVCVQCGLLAGEIQTLFLYHLQLEEPRKGCPSFIGHTSVLPPVTVHAYGIKRDESWYQVTPDGQSLVLLGNVKIPFCREGRISCSCSICASALLDESKIRIVQLNAGYVTVVLELKANDSLLSILVCDPNYLVALEENGRLHVWIMNLSWSGQVDDFDLSTSDRFSPCIVELKKVPKCAALVVGYTAFGEFTLWDISRRILVSKFSSPSTSLNHFLPISSLSYSWKDLSSSTKSDDRMNNIMASTKKSFQKNSDDGQIEGDEIAVWILASAVENDYQSNALALGGLWRLALLAKNSVIFGSPLDTRASSVGALSGNGILGTSDGLVYMWDLSNGTKLGNLHQFKGGSVSCIVTDDDSTSGFLAVAGENGDLMVYQSHQIQFPNC